MKLYLKNLAIVVISFLIIPFSFATLPLPKTEGNWNVLSRIINNTSVPSAWRDEMGHSRIYFQIIYGSEELAVKYISSDKLSAARIEGGARLIDYAVYAGSQASVRALLRQGASVNSISPKADSPLMLAASKGNLEIMRMLIAAKANVTYRTSTGMDAMRRALQGGKVYAANLLIENGYQLDKIRMSKHQGGLIFDAIEGNSHQAVLMLIENSFDVTQNNAEGETPLTFAIKSNSQPGIVELLLDSNVGVCRENLMGETPKRLAEKRINEQGLNPLLILIDQKCIGE